MNHGQNRVTLTNSKCEITGDVQLLKVFGMFTAKLRPSPYLLRLERLEEIEAANLSIGRYAVRLYLDANLEIGDFEDRVMKLVKTPSFKSRWIERGEVLLAMSDHDACT